MARCRPLCLFWLCLSLITAEARAEPDWSQFRGSGGTATSQAPEFPDQWTEETRKWKVAPLGLGISSPSIYKDRFIVTSARDDGVKRTIECRSLNDGSLLWQFDVAFDTHPKHAKNSFATATSACDETGSYSVFGSPAKHVVVAMTWDGKERWTTDLGPFQSQHGPGASPVLWGPYLYLPHEQDGPSSIVAIERTSGKIAWRASRESTLAAYSTPLVMDEQLVVCSSRTGMAALDLRTGAPLWSESCFDQRCVNSPIRAGNLVIASCGSGGRGSQFVALRSQPTLSAGEGRTAWNLTKTIPYCPTPIAAGPWVYFVTDQGIARCVTAETGKEVWTERLMGDVTASLICVGDRLVAIGENGDAAMLRIGDKFDLVARNKLEDEFVTTPAIAGNTMIVRGKSFIHAIGPATSD